MATFDPYSDSPFKIRHEGQEIVVRQNRLSPTTIRISWTIPQSVSCELPAAYNGAIVTLDRTPTALEKLPLDGTIYKSDPTADINLHAADKIGTALVVGTFYNDTTSTYVDIFDAPEDEPYYVSVHAVDNVYRYHTDGVHSYSLPYARKKDEPTAAYQQIRLGAAGVQAYTGTKLDPTVTYTVKLHIDGSKPDYDISILGANALNYGDLVNALSRAFVRLEPSVVSVDVPLLDSYWVDAAKAKVYKHNGTQYVEQSNPLFLAFDPLVPATGEFWLNPTAGEMSQWNGTSWEAKTYHKIDRDPRNPYCNDYWFDGTTLFKWNGGAWIMQRMFATPIDPQLPPIMNCSMFWVNNGKAMNWDDSTCAWNEVTFFTTAPANPASGDLWYDATALTIKVWDSVDAAWVSMPTTNGPIDPSKAIVPVQGTVWFDTIGQTYYRLDGTSWVEFAPIFNPVKPQAMADGALWLNTRTNAFSRLQMGMWQPVRFITRDGTAPNDLAEGQLWFDRSKSVLNVLMDGLWTQLPFEIKAQSHPIGMLWVDPTTYSMKRWNGNVWEPSVPKATASLDDDGHLILTSGTKGSTSNIYLAAVGTLFNGLTMAPLAMPMMPVKGTDPVSEVPSYMQLGVGTDGSQDERRNLVQQIKGMLGWPSVEVELTKEQMDLAIDQALDKLRQASSSAYKRAYFPLDLMPRVQHYKLTDTTVGFNKIVDIFYVYRMQATFMGSAQGNSVYGQMAVQQLFNMGKFDMLSYHMVSSYIKTMQQVLASEIMFGWDEQTRVLQIMKDFPQPEKVLVDGMIERTEQDLMTDRWTKSWIRKYAAAQCRYMLAEIRGKFSSLPGAGGAISLNANDLRAQADKDIEECMADIDNYVVNNKNDFGQATDFVLG